MKTLLNRFRKWLIVKLGGYTSQLTYSNCVTVEESATIDNYGFANPDYENFFKEHLVNDLSIKLYKCGLIQFYQTPLYDDGNNAKIITASIKVYKNG